MKLPGKILTIVIALIIIGMVFAVAVNILRKPGIERLLSASLGVSVEFTDVDLNLEEYTVEIRGLEILSGKEFKKNTLYAERCAMTIDKNAYVKEKRFLVKEITMEDGRLSLERSARGAWNIADITLAKAECDSGSAYAAGPAGAAPLYALVTNVAKINVTNFTILISDNCAPGGPFKTDLYDFNLKLDSERELESVYGHIPVKFTIDFKIKNNDYRDSEVLMQGKFSAYPGGTAVDAVITMSYVDIMKFQPYFGSNMPFSFTNGLFSSTTNLSLRDNNVDSSTTVLFHKVNLLINEGMENASFLETEINKLVPYLMSRGEILFDFFIKGPVNAPEMGVGPGTRAAMNAYFMEGVNKALSQF